MSQLNFFTEGVYANILSGPPPPAFGPIMAPGDRVILLGGPDPLSPLLDPRMDPGKVFHQ